MKFGFRRSPLTVITLGVAVAGVGPHAARGQPVPAISRDAAEINALAKHFEDERSTFAALRMSWTFIHAASPEQARAAMEAVGLPDDGSEFSMRAAIARAGGLDAYRARLTRLLESDDEVVRGWGASWLGALGDRRATPDLLKLLRAPVRPANFDKGLFFSGYGRAKAAMALGLLGATEHADEIAVLLGSSDWFDRCEAAMGLGYMRSTKHAPAIVKMMNSGDSNVVHHAIAALAEMGSDAYVPAIVAKLDSGDADVRGVATYALARLGAKLHAPAIAALLKDAANRPVAARALALLEARDQIPALAAILAGADRDAAADAALALAMLGATEHEDAIAAQLGGGGDEHHRRAAAWALILLGSEKHATAALANAGARDSSPFLEGPGAFTICASQLGAIDRRARANFDRLSKR